MSLVSLSIALINLLLCFYAQFVLVFFEWLLFLKGLIRTDNQNTGVINSRGESEIKAKRNSIRDMVTQVLMVGRQRGLKGSRKESYFFLVAQSLRGGGDAL